MYYARVVSRRLARSRCVWVRKVTTTARRIVCLLSTSDFSRELVGLLAGLTNALRGYGETLCRRVLVADDVLGNESVVVLFSHDPNVPLKGFDDAVMPRMDVDVVHL